MLFSTGLSQVVVTELQQCCFQQVCRKLLTQNCSNAVFNRPVASCCDRATAMLFSTGLSQVVDTELQQCCFRQLVTDLLQIEESAL
jgi:hypothetical protein